MLKAFLGFNEYLLSNCHRFPIIPIIIIVVITSIIIFSPIVIRGAILIVLSLAQQTTVETICKFLYPEGKLYRTN